MKGNNEFLDSPNNDIIVFKPSNGELEYEVVIDVAADTIWATEQQIAKIFDRDSTVIFKHIKNIYKTGELDENSTIAKNAIVRNEGGRDVKRNVVQYNLDVILSVGYRIKSQRATEFRKWSTQKLKEYLIKGYVINEELLKNNSEKIAELENRLSNLNQKVFNIQNNLTDGFLSIISKYSKSFELLNRYDTEDFNKDGLSEEFLYVINYNDVKNAIDRLKENLKAKGEASSIFGNEKDDSFKGMLGSISQTVFGELAYPTIEEQAAQLLYSIIKGHAFSDGNKRIGSFIFVWFLERNKIHLNKAGKAKINDNALVAIALAVAQSAPEQRELIVSLIISLIKN